MNKSLKHIKYHVLGTCLDIRYLRGGAISAKGALMGNVRFEGTSERMLVPGSSGVASTIKQSTVHQ